MKWDEDEKNGNLRLFCWIFPASFNSKEEDWIPATAGILLSDTQLTKSKESFFVSLLRSTVYQSELTSEAAKTLTCRELFLLS